MSVKFADRRDGGRALAAELGDYAGRADTNVLALPRGGVPVAYEVAKALHAPLDVFVVRKLGVPGHEEFAFGAIASGGVIISEDTVRALHMPQSVIDAVVKAEQKELERREQLYRMGNPLPDLKGKTVIIVDDGLATGATMKAAVKAVRAYSPSKLIVAAPVAAHDTCSELGYEADVMCVCAVEPEPFYGVGLWYSDFSQTSDSEVRALLAEARAKERKLRSAA